MATKASRYRNPRKFADTDDQRPVFAGLRSRPIGPATGVLEYLVKEDDRLDLLALYFYNDSHKWWRILDADPDVVFGADLTLAENIGSTILIPRAVEPGAGR